MKYEDCNFRISLLLIYGHVKSITIFYLKIIVFSNYHLCIFVVAYLCGYISVPFLLGRWING